VRKAATAGLEPQGDALTRGTLVGLVLSCALVPLASTTIAVALTAIGDDLGAEPAALTQWLVNSYLVVAIVLQSPAGKLGDLWGARRALALGQVLFATGSVLGFQGGSLPVLVGARVTMAAGGALLVPAAMALVRNSTAANRRARVFGLFGSSMALSAATGPLLGGLLVEAFGWRSIFLANLPVLALAAPLVRGLREPLEGRPRAARFDWAGTVLLGAALASVLGGSKTGGTAAAGLFALGAALLFVFVQWERRASDPVLDPALFRNVAFAAGGSIIALHNLAMYALLFQLPLWFTSALGSSSAEVGPVLLAMMLSMVVAAPLGGRASEKLGARAVALVGTSSSLAGLLLLTNLAGIAKPSDAVFALVLMGTGLGLANAPAQASALSAVDRGQAGMAAATLSMMRYVGGIVGIGILGAVLSGVPADIGLQALPAHRSAIVIFCAAMALALVPAALLPGRAARAR